MATGDKYIMNGVWLTCDKGVTPTRFTVLPKPVQLYEEPYATEFDKVPLLNILPFGLCQVTRTPCVPAPVMWQGVMEEGLTVLGGRPLLDTSKCACGVGGKISIHFTRADADAAVALDQVDQVAEAAEEAAGWCFWGGVALAVGGAILCATGVGAPLGAAMIAGGKALITVSTVLGTAAAVTKGVTKFARDPSQQNGLSIVGEVAQDLVIEYVMNKLGGKVVKKLGEAAQKAMNRLNISERASALANRLLCTVTGHPVDVISGYLYTEAVDFELAGPIPLRWERLWNSTSIHQGALGHGWHHAYDLALCVDAEQGVVALRAGDGRGIAFEGVALGQRAYNRLEKLSLLHEVRGYAVLDHGKELTYRFGMDRGDGVWPLLAVENAHGFAITFHYDAQGHLSGITDSAGRELQVSCDEQGRLRAITAPHPTEPRQQVVLVAYAYDRQGQLVRVQDALGQAATYEYAQRLLVRETFKNGLNFYFEYAGAGPEARCIRTWGDEGIYDHRLAYDVAARRTVVTNSLGQATTYQGNEQGLVVQTIDARGGASFVEYNEYNEVLSETDALGNETRYAYDERGNRVLAELPDGATLQFVYDAHDRCTQATDAVGGQWQWTYDEAGNLLARTNPLGNTARYVYVNGLLQRLTDAARRTTELVYDDAYNLREVRLPGGTTRRWLSDGWSRVRKLTDERGNVQWREYDLLSRITTVHEPDGNVRRFTYDALDNVVRFQDRHQDVQYAYRGLGRLIRRVEAGTVVEFLHDTEEQLRAIVNEHGLAYRFELDGVGDVVTEVGFDGLTRRYERDIGGRVQEMNLPDGRRTRYAYDRRGRVTEVVYGDGATETYRYRPDGALLEAANETTTVSFARNVLGQVEQERQGEHTVGSEYDPLGYRVGVTSSLGAAVRYSRDAAGQVQQIKAGEWQALFVRDAQGLEIQRTLSGGVQARWKRDALGRPTEQRIRTGNTRIAERVRSYGWQENDRLSSIQDSAHGLTRFEHDAVGNLAATIFADGTRELRQPDAVGNLFRTADRQDRRYGPAGQLLEANGTRYAYDTVGNLRQKTLRTGEEWHYVWNSAGYLQEVVRPDGTVVRFTYDVLGRRISKSYRGKVTRWVWDGDKPLHEWRELQVGPSTGAAVDLITWLFEEERYAPVGKMEGEQHYSILTDHLGTPMQMHNERGQSVWATELNSYGQVRQQQGESAVCPFRYQGQYEDLETGLYYNRFRYYDPEVGIYISQDPTRLAGGHKLHGYVHDPNKYLDIFGLECKPGYHYRQGNAQDPGLDDFITDLENRGVTVVGKNLEIIKTATGDVVGEVDVLTRNAAIQYKNGASSADAITKQITEKTEPYIEKPVIGFIRGANGTTKGAVRTVKNAGKNHLVTNDIDLLADVLK